MNFGLAFSAENVSTALRIDASALCYRRAEDIHVLPVVVAELKFSNVQRHIFGADFVERAGHCPFEDRPKSLNRVGGTFFAFGPRGIAF
jgi:hypothetical protein